MFANRNDCCKRHKSFNNCTPRVIFWKKNHAAPNLMHASDIELNAPASIFWLITTSNADKRSDENNRFDAIE
jgi:hypothetical protein